MLATRCMDTTSSRLHKTHDRCTTCKCFVGSPLFSSQAPLLSLCRRLWTAEADHHLHGSHPACTMMAQCWPKPDPSSHVLLLCHRSHTLLHIPPAAQAWQSGLPPHSHYHMLGVCILLQATVPVGVISRAHAGRWRRGTFLLCALC